MSCINGPTAPGRPEGPGRVAVAVLCLRRGSHARAHRQQGSHDRAHLAAGSHDVIPPQQSGARAYQTPDRRQTVGIFRLSSFSMHGQNWIMVDQRLVEWYGRPPRSAPSTYPVPWPWASGRARLPTGHGLPATGANGLSTQAASNTNTSS